MAEDDAERTEAPTPKRLEKSRRKGEVAKSRDLAGVAVLATALLVLASALVARLAESLAMLARGAWSGAQIHASTLPDFHALLLHHFAEAARALAPCLLALVLAGVAAHVLQTGPMLAPEALNFRGQRLNPLQGLKRLLNQDRLFELGKALVQVAVVGGALYWVVRASLDGVLALVNAPADAGLHAATGLAMYTGRVALAGLGVLAVLDFAWVTHRHHKRLRMTPREVRDELREREGSPQVRSRRRQLQRELSRHRMLANVAKADVVVTNPTHFAVALRYVRSEMAAPKVVARGRDALAERIRAEARRHDVPIVSNPPLARVLYRATRVGREVPEQLFQAVAEVLAHVYRMDRRRGNAWSTGS